MKRFTIIDLPIFIWDKDHFDGNKTAYYQLMMALPTLYEDIIKNNITILLRSELQSEILTHFPYDIIPNMFYSFQLSTLQFLSNVKMQAYPNKDDETVISDPDLVKSYFKPSTQKEVRFLVTHLHSNVTDIIKMLSVSLFWTYEKSLVLHNSRSIEIETFLFDREDRKKTISKLKRIFEHNPKHNSYKTGSGISPLSCYNDREGDPTKAQELLDSSVEFQSVDFQGDYFNFDYENQTYVTFVHTVQNIYHGYDVQLSEDEKIKISKVLNG